MEENMSVQILTGEKTDDFGDVFGSASRCIYVKTTLLAPSKNHHGTAMNEINFFLNTNSLRSG